MFAPATLFAAFAAFASVEALPISQLATVEASLNTPNTTQTGQKVAPYKMNGNAGACGWYNQNSAVVVGLPLEFYSKLDSVSPYCGDFVVVTDPSTNKTVTALVADASTQNNTLSVSQGTYAALDGSNTDLKYVDWRFANETETTAAKAALSGSDSPSSSTSAWSAPSSSSSSSEWTAPSSSSSEWTAPSSSSSSWTAPSSSKAEKPSSTSTWEKPTTTSTWEKPTSTSTWEAPTTTSKWVAPTTTTTQWVAPTTTTTTKAWTPTTTQAAATTKASYSSASSGSYSGQATFYSQNGVAGSCGNVNSDSAYIVAMNVAQVDGGAHCGQQVHITNTQNGKSITCTVADTCPGCGYGSLDLSKGAFGALGSYDQGVLPITWSYV
ncbi:hypothetical protein JCM8202_004782 [Rhodotorula sphaerocarpa]